MSAKGSGPDAKGAVPPLHQGLSLCKEMEDEGYEIQTLY